MSREALDRFFASTNLGYMEWHEGIGYDTSALAQLDDSERAEVEDFLVARAERDWRDVDALAAIGSERALRAIESTLSSKNYVLRCHALEHLAARDRIESAEIVRQVVEMLQETTIANGMTHVLALAKRYRGDAIKRQLLRCALRGNDDVRVHAAALVHHLWGPARTDFDWGHRGFYLQFGGDEGQRRTAFEKLCAQIGVAPGWIGA